MIITKKIEIRVNTEDKKTKAEIWAYLRNLTREISIAANKAMSHRYFMEEAIDKLVKPDLLAIESFENQLSELNIEYSKYNFRELSKSEQKIQKELADKIAKIQKEIYKLNSDARKNARNEFGKLVLAGEEGKENGMTLQGLTYRFLKVAELPGTIHDALSSRVNSDYDNDQKDVTLGKRSLRTYKSQFIPFRIDSVKQMDENGFQWIKLPNGERIQFSFVYGADKSAKHGHSLKDFIKKCIAGVHKISDGQILKIQDRKIYWNMAVDIGKIETENKIDAEKSMGVHISFLMPIAMATADGKAVKQLGNNQDFLDRRYQFNDRLSRNQARLRMVKSGTGRQKINKALDKFNQLERNFVNTYNFTLAKEVVKFAIKNGCGIIKIVNLSDVSNLVSEESVLRYWSYYDLQTKIFNKAKQYGIEVKKVSPNDIYNECAESFKTPDKKKPETELELISKFLSSKIEKIDYKMVKKIANSDNYIKKST